MINLNKKQMGTLNGVGTDFNGFSELDAEGNFTATNWFTVFYFPFFPLWKANMKRQLTDCNVFQYQIISYEKLNGKEILLTYLYGWIITPLLFIWPLILSIKEIAHRIGIPIDSGYEWVHLTMISVGIVYLLVFSWKWKDWMEERGLPRDYKERLKQLKQDKKWP